MIMNNEILLEGQLTRDVNECEYNPIQWSIIEKNKL